MSGFRWEIEASAGPAREGVLGGGSQLLVRVTLFNDELEGSEPAPEAYTDLRPRDARRLAIELLAAAEDADWQTEQAGYWERAR
jgi:hypothetical protein